MAREKSDPQLVGSARAQAGEIEIPDDDALASRMIAATEDEIWRDATMLQDDDDSGDKTLEAMDEGFDGEQEGEPSEEDEIAAQGQEDEPEPSDEDDEDTSEEFDEPAPAARQPQRPQPQARQPVQADPTVERIARLEGELNALRQQQNRPPPPAQPTAPAKPDMWTDPEGYEKYVLEQAEARAMARFQQTQNAERETRLNASFDSAAKGERGQEFMAAYNSLSNGPRQGQQGFEMHAAVVQGIVNSPDPVRALFDWWEQTGGMDQYQQGILAQAEAILGRQIAPRRGERGNPEQQPSRPAGGGPRPTRTLNGRAGSGTHRAIDPEMFNGSESSIFDYATRN